MSSYSGSDITEDKDDRNISCGRTASGIIEKSKSSKRLKTEVPATIIKDNLPHESTPLDNNTINTAVVISGHQDHDAVGDVTERFIVKFNSHRGNAENVAQAQRLLKKTRLLAGLDAPDGSHPYIDVPSARRNLILLAGLDHQELKMNALRSLIEVLEADQIKRNTAFDLIVLAIDLMKQMDRELMQTQLVEEQICICQAYGIVAELIQRHYAKKHLGGITAELKTQLINTAQTLEDLNTHSDPALHFAVEYALEGVKRLRDDRKELFEIFERVFHLLTAAVAFHDDCPSMFTDQVQSAYQGLDIRFTHAWYDSTMLFNELVKKACKDRNQLLLLQYMVKQNVLNLDWKFLYNAIDKFARIAREGSTHSICKAALMGQKIVKEQYPGIIDFIDFNHYELKTSLKPVIHFKPPISKDNNIRIRMLCIETLVQIAQKSPHASLRKKAKLALVQRSKIEVEPEILNLITSIVPTKNSQQILWVNEQPPYVHTIMQTSEKPTDLKPALSEKTPLNQIQTIAEHAFPTAPAPPTPYFSPNATATTTKVSFHNPDDDLIFGKALLKTKQPSEALEYFNAALQKVGEHENQNILKGKVLYQIGLTYLSMGKTDSAEATWLNSLKVRPKSYVVNIALARLYKTQGRTLEASHYGEKALSCRPEDKEAKKYASKANRKSAQY